MAQVFQFPQPMASPNSPSVPTGRTRRFRPLTRSEAVSVWHAFHEEECSIQQLQACLGVKRSEIEKAVRIQRPKAVAA